MQPGPVNMQHRFYRPADRSAGSRSIDEQMVVHVLYTWHCPGGMFDRFAFTPAVNVAFELHLIAFGGDTNFAGIQFRASCQGLLDQCLDVQACSFGFDDQPVIEARDACKGIDGFLCGFFLVLPLHIALTITWQAMVG